MNKAKKINRLGTILFVIVLALIIPLSVPRFFGYGTYAVLSDSMTPALPVGAIAYVKGVPPASLKSGDVITFYGKANAVITHRIVKVESQYTYITKGDHNNDVDLAKVKATQIIGRVEFSMPIMGYFLLLFANKMGILLLIFILFVIIYTWNYNPKEK